MVFGAIIDVERFDCLEKMPRLTAYIQRLCMKLFERLKGKIDKLLGLEDVMKKKRASQLRNW